MINPIRRHQLAAPEIGPALRALCSWTPADAPAGALHPGDLGWHLRFEAATVFLWTTDAAPVAVGLLDGPVLRVTVAPGFDPAALAADAEQVLGPHHDRCDGVPIRGWSIDGGKPWLVMSWRPRPVSGRAGPVGEDDAADRVLVQRSAFAGSTFTLARWRAMKRSLAGNLAVETIVRTCDGRPAAAATGWFAGAGRCGLLEPVATHPDHRRRGHGRDAVLGACAALVDRGASAVAVAVPAANEAAVALYGSAGFVVVRESRDWVRGC